IKEKVLHLKIDALNSLSKIIPTEWNVHISTENDSYPVSGYPFHLHMIEEPELYFQQVMEILNLSPDMKLGFYDVFFLDQSLGKSGAREIGAFVFVPLEDVKARGQTTKIIILPSAGNDLDLDLAKGYLARNFKGRGFEKPEDFVIQKPAADVTIKYNSQTRPTVINVKRGEGNAPHFAADIAGIVECLPKREFPIAGDLNGKTATETIRHWLEFEIRNIWGYDGDDLQRIISAVGVHMDVFNAAGPNNGQIQFYFERKASSSPAQEPASSPGGIALNGKTMKTDVVTEGQSSPIIFDPAVGAQLLRGDFTGMQGIILNVIPIRSVLPILGLNDDPGPADVKKLSKA
ncbi:MAG: hypothetical protein HQL23_09315, partial [Candidatus Omnitrophica bacterium]|nr:hypothetical protein [Candidatus Omnitrophota bacterium]